MKVFLPLLIISICAPVSHTFADGPGDRWLSRGNFVLVYPDSDRIKNLFGGSIEVLRDTGFDFRVGVELGIASGDGESTAISVQLDWIQALLMGEYTIQSLQGENFEPYVGLGVGIASADARGSISGVPFRDDDTAVAIKPVLGADILITGKVGLNLQGGYLWSNNDVPGVDNDFSGFEGKAGVTYRF